jgi:anti-anti-sigma factor
MSLKVEKEVNGKTMILHIDGILDISTTHVIESYFHELDDNMETLIFDFTNLEFIDSTGIGSIMNAIYLSQEKHFKLKFQGINDLTNQLFETVGLYQILKAIQGSVLDV